MKKNIDWLKKWIYEYEDEIGSWLGDKHTGDYFSTRLHGGLSAIKEIREKLNQLDEPEVLSQEWLEAHTYHEDEYDFYYMDPDEVKEALVPKQEKVKIESVWAEDIEDAKANGMTLFKAMNWMAIDSDEKEKQDLFARAWLDGYEVEGEQKYYVLDSEDIPLLERVNDQTCKTTTGLSIYEDGRDNSRFELTEQEVKDYDERFWPFTVKVEELEK